MKEMVSKTVLIGFSRSPAAIADEIEQLSRNMLRDGYRHVGTATEEHLRQIVLTFEKEIEVR
jgi:hypothetical protein